MPNADYIFYGSNLSEFVPSSDELDASNDMKNSCPINCKPSLYDFMQTSAGINESITFDSVGSVFVSRSRDPVLRGC